MSFNRLSGLAVFGLCVSLLVGCDMSRYDPISPDKPSGSEKKPIPAGKGDPVTLYSCLIWNSDQIDKAYIPLETGVPADARSESGYFTFVQTGSLDGKSYLMPLLESGVKLPEWGYDNIIVYARDSSFRTVKIQVLLRPSEVEKLSSPTSSDINERLSFIFSHAVNPNVDAVGAIKVYPVLQEGVIKKHITVNSEHGQFFSQEHGSSIEEVTENHSYAYGLSGIMNLFTGNIGGSIKKSSYNRAEYEYIMGTKMFYASQGALRWNNITPLLCIDKNFNDLINNPGSDNYKKYEDTEAGIFALLQDYGSSIVCTASLGAYGEYIYSRKKNISQNSIAWDLKLGLEKYSKSSGNDTSSFPYLKALASLGVKVSADLDKVSPSRKKAFSAEFSTAHEYKRYLETNKTNVDVFVSGGNSLSVNVSNDLSAFNATDDCRNWIICSYLYSVSECDASSNPYPFKSISALVHDTTSVRGKLICDMLRPYKKDGRMTCKFYDMFELPEKQKATPVVLADFRCVLTPVSNGIYPYVGAPKPLMMEGPDGKARLYHALMTGPWTPNLEQIKMQGYVFDFSFNYSNAKKHDVNFYYALDYSDECEGLTDIIMVMDSQPAGYIRYPEDPSKGQTNGKRFIAVKLGNKSTPVEDKIKSVGLYNVECENVNCIMTATGGGEIPINYTPDEISDICRMWNGTPAEGNTYKFANKAEGGREVVKYYTPETGSEYICGAGFGNRNPVMNICWTKIPIKKRVSVDYINNDYPGYYPSEIHEPLVWEADMK